MKWLLGLALLVSAAAQSAPVPNLVLTCSDENAVGQEQNACDGIWAYQVPTNALIVSQGSLGIWRTFGDLIGADTVLVCTVPVEPGQYSSCRDAVGVRRTAFVRKDSIMGGGSVTVDATGGDYTDPVTAAQNAFAGDTWCVAPQWPAQPCVIAIGDGVFILHETLSIPEGLVVAGAGKGATMLVADNGVDVAVSTINEVRISGLTIVNSQPGGGQTTGVVTGTVGPGQRLVQLHDVAVHVAGAAKNIAVHKAEYLEVLDSDISAVGQDSIGILDRYSDGSRLTLERSRVSAESAIEEAGGRGVLVRLVDSHVSGTVFIAKDGVRLEIIGSGIVGSVSSALANSSFIITDSTIRGDVSNRETFGAHALRITNSRVDGRITFGFGGVTVDRLTLHGEFDLVGASGTIVRSYVSSAGTAAALFLRPDSHASNIQLEQTFIQGAVALAAANGSRLESSSSVLAGPISASGTAVLSCTDTYGADYELLTVSCQPQPP